MKKIAQEHYQQNMKNPKKLHKASDSLCQG